MCVCVWCVCEVCVIVMGYVQLLYTNCYKLHMKMYLKCENYFSVSAKPPKAIEMKIKLKRQKISGRGLDSVLTKQYTRTIQFYS